MRYPTVAAVARELAATLAIEPPPASPGAARYTPRLVCLAARIDAPRIPPPGWDPEAYRVAAVQDGWRRWWLWLRTTRWARRLWPPPRRGRLLMAAMPGRMRITLDGVHADTSTFHLRS